ncbi:aspartate/glutamate racemase family protein [Campylobacter sp. RM16187]|uniref:aspartate/glutamate racemase family protein n=1 Tax=Campylobacter sp. RM16187 TaxID=1660063 RepID=UPI0021B5BD64|nr:aspartate/glutamate racemase family protein [Campylobacter sp. RM16187]QKG30047.1 aspartate racemase [Campylobacter sp. RM16187]
MKKIGLIGGMSYESTATYYNEINRKVNNKLGGLNSAEILLSSVNFEEIELCQHENRWDDAGEILARHAKILELGGADFILICTNTMHKVYEMVRASVKIPVIHIADATLKALKECSVDKVGLFGTIYTMKEAFYKDKLSDGGVEVLLPSEDEMKFVNEVIFNELCFGKISATSRYKFLDIISNLASRGAKGVILGCTEIGLLIDQSSTDVKLFDTTFIHIDEAVNLALG